MIQAPARPDVARPSSSPDSVPVSTALPGVPPVKRPNIMKRIGGSRWLPWTLLVVFAAGTSVAGAQAVNKDAEARQLRAALASDASAYQQLQGETSTLQSDLQTLQTQYDALRSDNSELSAKVSDLDRLTAAVEYREAKLDDREAKLDNREKELGQQERDLGQRERELSIVENNTFEDGLFNVGADIKAGTYHTDGGKDCYWAKLSSSDTFDIISNNLSSGPQTVTIDSPWFDSKDCGTWVPVR